MTAEFDLRLLVREELATSPVADPHVVAEHVAKQVPDEHLRDALRACLPEFVRIIGHGSVTTPRASGAPRSAKCDDQAWYRGVLRRRVEVGQDGREWKFLGECTLDDVLRAAEVRREMAAANAAAADQFDRLAGKMRTFRAATVADLDAGLLGEVFG